MLNSSSISHGGNASLNLKINAVSGSLIKNHAKSFFVKVNADSEEGQILFSNSPMWPEREFGLFNGRMGKRQEDCVGAFGMEGLDIKKGHWKPVQILQAMILGDNNFFCEIVYEEDLIQENEE
jgi:hypothetical protein